MARVNGQDLSISPPFSPYDFLSRCDFSTLLTLRQIDYWFNFTYSRSHAFHYGCQSKIYRPVKNRTNEPALLSMRVYPLQHTPLGRRLLNLALVRLLTGLFFCSDFGSGKSGVIPDFRAGLHVFTLTAIRHWVGPELSSHPVGYRWRSLPRVRRHRTRSFQGSSSNWCFLCITMDQPMCASLFQHQLLVAMM